MVAVAAVVAAGAAAADVVDSAREAKFLQDNSRETKMLTTESKIQNSAVKVESRLGIGWRPELSLAIDRRDDLEFVEVVAENVMFAKQLPQPLVWLKEKGLDVIPHAISLSLGGAELPDEMRLRKLNDFAKAVDAPFVSDHIAFVRAGGLESGHLLPVPRTERALKVVVENVKRAQDALDVPLVLENIAYLCDWNNSEMSEAEFVSRVLEEADAMLLLDVANLYANSLNHTFSAIEFLRNIPLERLAYVHVAGGTLKGKVYHDTHAHDVPKGVLNLLRQLCMMHQPPRVMLERDDRFPQQDEVYKELNAIKLAVN